ncbi:phospholipid phosphatase homolog 1.2 homolog [Chironomus tepperi]|uniref:phospholipid phosphatase homolog 1.2 homolog n=1 Tax=Chironomus tepperi TaxID=113505 RepID=UPI00391F3B3B
MKKVKIVSSLITFIQCTAVLAIPVAISFTVPIAKRGFFCNDPALSLPRLSDTIPNSVLIFWGFSPIFVLLLCEIVFNRKTCDSNLSCLNVSWRNTSYLYHRYVINLVLMHVILFTVKYCTRSHRPHFFETCKPDALLTCKDGTFVQNYTCTNTKAKSFDIIDSSQSFFSGHAAVCFYSCTFIAWYLHKRIKSRNVLWLPLVQALLISLAYFGSVSRVFDHRHHAIDVTVGSIVGILTCIHAWLYQCRTFEYDFQSLPSACLRKIAPMPPHNGDSNTNTTNEG